NMIVYESNENKVLFDYWKYVFMVKDSVNRLSMLGNKLLRESKGKPTKELDELQEKVNNFNNSIMVFAHNLAIENKGSFVATLLEAYQMPDFFLYKKIPGAKPYNTSKEFYKEHFFDNFNFKDTRLLRSEIIYIAISDYMRNFTANATTNEYIEVLDFILSKVAVNPEIYKYVVELFISNFEYSVWEKVYVHLIEEHYTKIINPDPVIAAAHYKKVESIKNLEPGNPAPKIKFYNTDLKKVDFYDIDAKVKLLFIWGPGCENCEAILPDIKEVYELYDSLGFEVIAIAVTDNKRVWKKAIKEQNVNWTNLSDLKGAKSELADKYNVWLTPAMFLLDSNNIIISRPKFKSEIYAKLVELLN
ncbi:MAG: redoxin domain-containing protein, partial [Saprospiraceae bacterium]|nr:redoxin domain-containing protein [Saprospiraceae bacterium]